MRTFQLSICFTLAIATWAVNDANAQQSSRHRSVRSSEKAARASWQPTRPKARQQPSSAQALTHSGQALTDPGPNQLRRVDHITVKGVPVPPPETVSIVEGESLPVPQAERVPIAPTPQPLSSPVHSHQPLDGQISLTPVHEGSLPCDAGPCGCGDSLCGGDCGSCCGTPGNCCNACSSCGTGGCSMCGELCSPKAWRPCVTLCVPQDGWLSFEYLGWWQDGMSLPPLVTTSSDPNVPRAQAGVLTSPTTQILFGGRDVLDDGFDGGRLRFGVWLDRCHTWGIGAEYFQIGSESVSFLAASTGDPILARPFFNTETGVEDAELVAFPNVLTGTVGVTATSEFSGGGFHLRRLNCCDEGCSRWFFCGCPGHYCSRLESMYGYRYLELQEGVQITEDLVSTDPDRPGTFDIIDQFDTRNQFNGFDIGWMYRTTRGFWTYDCLLRMAIGNNRQTVTISGQTTINDPNDPPVETFQGGLLTQTSNIGMYRQNEFAIVPEINLNLGYQLTDHLRATVGYTFIYWSNVARPGEHISRDLNPQLLPEQVPPITGAQRPAFAFDTTDYWAQGISFGGEYRW